MLVARHSPLAIGRCVSFANRQHPSTELVCCPLRDETNEVQLLSENTVESLH